MHEGSLVTRAKAKMLEQRKIVFMVKMGILKDILLAEQGTVRTLEGMGCNIGNEGSE